MRRLVVTLRGDDLVLLPGLLDAFFRDEVALDLAIDDNLVDGAGSVGVDKTDKDGGDTGEWVLSDSVS